jgi:hypothetical protein
MATIDLDNLPSLDLGSLPALFEDPSARAKSQSALLASDRRHVRRVERRRYVRMQQQGRAVEHIGALPCPGESIHGVMSGRYDLWQLVSALIELGGPINRLTVSTLGFSRRHSDELFAMLDAGTIAKVLFVVSHYFRSSDVGVFEHLHSGLTCRGQRVAVLRCHAKLLLAETAEGRNLVIETSGNMRSSQNAEQWTLCDDPELLAFHQQWLTELVTQTEQEGNR